MTFNYAHAKEIMVRMQDIFGNLEHIINDFEELLKHKVDDTALRSKILRTLEVLRDIEKGAINEASREGLDALAELDKQQLVELTHLETAVVQLETDARMMTEIKKKEERFLELLQEAMKKMK